MPIRDIREKVAETLDGSRMLIVLKKTETELVQLTGTIDGTNKTFTFPATHYPLGANSYKRVTPIAADVIIYTRKGTTDLGVEVTTVDTITDPDTGYVVYGEVTLTAAPTAEGTDSVWALCTVEHDVYVQQSIKPKVDQDTSDIERMGSREVFEKTGKIKSNVDVEILIADLEAIILGNYDESSETGVETGFSLYELRDNPIVMSGYIPIFDEDETDDPKDRGVMAYVMLESVTKMPTLPEGSPNKELTATMKLNIGQKPKILLKDAA